LRAAGAVTGELVATSTSAGFARGRLVSLHATSAELALEVDLEVEPTVATVFRGGGAEPVRVTLGSSEAPGHVR
jgi:hypothetical protein